MICMLPIERHGSIVDRLIYRGGVVAHKALCQTETTLTRTHFHSFLSLLLVSSSVINVSFYGTVW